MIIISVVIPLYNKSLTIRRTIETVLAQTYKNYEIVVVDDGSTDDGPSIVESMDIDNLRLVRQENQGVSAARNRGVDESKGDYIAFLDGDDQWHPHFLDIMVGMIKDEPEASFYCSAGMGTNFNQTRRKFRVANKYQKRSQCVDFFENPAVFAHTSGTIVSKVKFKEIGGFLVGMKCCEDFRLFQMMALHGMVMFCGWPISKYVGDVPGQITKTDPQILRGWWKYVAQYYNDVYNEFIKVGGVNSKPTANIWLRYATRHRIKGVIHSKDDELLSFILSTFKYIETYTNFEITIYKYAPQWISLLWINITKIIWRFHGYPIVNEKIKNKEIPFEYINW